MPESPEAHHADEPTSHGNKVTRVTSSLFRAISKYNPTSKTDYVNKTVSTKLLTIGC